MDKERLFRYLDRKYSSKSEIIPNIPLGVDADAIWAEILQGRRKRGNELPLTNLNGEAYWYILTQKMISASEVIVEELMEQENTAELHRSTVSTIEEIYYTGFMEGAQISVQDAMKFLQSGEEPDSVEELILMNSRQAAGFAAENMYHAIDSNYLHNLAFFLTEGLDNGGGDYRTADTIEIPSMQGESVKLPPAAMIPEQTERFAGFLADTATHPLIKAVAAQAWVLAYRPFPEGNERLARLLSNVILIRAGYGFFGNISISSILARTSYDYFRAIANILRVENGADLTYFLEYYLNVLSDAVIEMRQKREQQEQDALKTEQWLAQMPLTITLETQPQKQPNSFDRVAAALKTLRAENAKQFTVGDIHERTGITKKHLYSILAEYEAELHIITLRRSKLGNLYAFAPEAPADEIAEEAGNAEASETESNASRDALISALLKQQKHGTDNAVKVAGVLLEYLRTGKVQFCSAEIAEKLTISLPAVKNSIKALKNRGHIISVGINKYHNIFQFAFAPVIETEDKKIVAQSLYSALENYLLDLIHKRRGKNVAALAELMLQYLAEGKTEFTSSDFTEALHMHPTQVNEILREMKERNLLTLLPAKGIRNIYRAADAKSGYADLKDDQKDTLQLLYDLFGEDSFSTEMVVSRLDYSEGQASGILQQFTLLRLLDSTSRADNKDFYKLCENPTDNPECFKRTA